MTMCAMCSRRSKLTQVGVDLATRVGMSRSSARVCGRNACDGSSDFSKKNSSTQRAHRHLDRRTQFVRDAVDYLQITPLYAPTDDQPADGLTKAVGADVIRRHLPYYTGTCDCPDMHNIYT